MSEHEKIEKISEEDSSLIVKLKTRTVILQLQAEKTLLEARNMELEQKNAILNIYIKYGLSRYDEILEDGTIFRKDENTNG